MLNSLWWPSLLVEFPVQNLLEGGTDPAAGTRHVHATFLLLHPTQHLYTCLAPSIQKEMKTMSPAPSVFYDLGLKTVLHVPSLAKYPEKISLTSAANTYLCIYFFHKDLRSPQDQVGWVEFPNSPKHPGITKSSIKHPCVCLQLQIYAPDQERLCVSHTRALLRQTLGSPDHLLLGQMAFQNNVIQTFKNSF